MIYSFLLVLIIVIPLYRRYFPVKHIPSINLETSMQDNKTVILDIRDYNVSYKNQVKGAINLPLPYLERNLVEVPHTSIHLVVSTPIEKNIGIRFLNKKGYKVTGFICLQEINLLEKV